MTDFTLDELRDAEIVPSQGGPNAWLVRFGDGDYRTVNRTPKHRLLLETDLLKSAKHGHVETIGDSGTTVTFTADVNADEYTITVNGDRISVPKDREGSVLEAYADEDFQTLANIHGDILENRVRVGLMDRLMPRFEDARSNGRLRKTANGWLIDETFIVQWDGENYLTENVDSHVVKGGETVKADEEHPARQLSFDIPDEVVIEDNGDEIELGEREARFLATVEALLNPQEYLTGEEADYIEEVVESVQDPIASLARTAEVTGFTDEKSGLYHGHGLTKHRLGDLGVTDEAQERLFYNTFDHAGVHEMKARREEFETATFDVFEDAANDDADKWEKIEYTSEQAPIPNSVRADIDERFQ